MTGEDLRKYRIAKQYTQRRLGELLGYTGQSADVVVQRWEYGVRPIPVKHFRRLSEVLCVPLEKFIP